MKDAKDVAKALFSVLLFVTVIVIGVFYTIHDFRKKLLQKIRDKKEMNVEVDELAAQLRGSYKSSHEDLREEFKSMQQLQTDVASQLVELKSIVAQFTALQHQNDDNVKQD
jgi:predicted PurR-regulated permease PerM